MKANYSFAYRVIRNIIKTAMEREVKSYEVKLFKVFILWRLRTLWVWTVIADNGEVIGRSSQGYVNRRDAEYNIRSLGMSLNNLEDNK